MTPEDYARKLTKSALVIRDALGAPTLVAVQEVENLDVLDALAAQPELAPFGYGAILVDGLDPRGINVGLLYRKDRVIGHLRAVRPGETDEQAKTRGGRDIATLLESPFFDLWAHAGIAEILSALHERLTIRP